MEIKEIKCKHCNTWNSFRDDSALCTHCGKALVDITSEDLESLERRKTTGEIKIKINPNDSWTIRALKRLFNVVQLIFLSILSFILWLIFAGPG
jgi:hypothetical protein